MQAIWLRAIGAALDRLSDAFRIDFESLLMSHDVVVVDFLLRRSLHFTASATNDPLQWNCRDFGFSEAFCVDEKSKFLPAGWFRIRHRRGHSLFARVRDDEEGDGWSGGQTGGRAMLCLNLRAST